MEFSSHILNWYYKEHRKLPWRTTKDPYLIWISEIILQQTRVNQGLDYYKRFISAFPTIKSLAEAKEDKVLKLWQGLGYYSRARNLHASAKYIHEELAGQFPNNYQSIIKLKGVGPYTAAAISSICFNEPKACVDGNVYRVLSRVFEIKTPTNTSKGIKEFQSLADQLIKNNHPGDFNQGIMELGATICTPKKPKCTTCPIESVCITKNKNTHHEFPVKEKKQKVKTRLIHYYCIEFEGSILMNKRINKDIWKNLYDFPHDEDSQPTKIKIPTHAPTLNQLLNGIEFKYKTHQILKHKLSHQDLTINIHHIIPNQQLKKNNCHKIAKSELQKLPVPKPIEKFIESLLDSA